MQISISGFIPTYNNNSETLITAIKSLEEQTVKLKKISVYDDGSKGDLDVRSLSANIVYKKYNKNRGRGFIRNQCVNDCDSEFLLFLDATNILPSDFVEKAIPILKRKEVAVVSGRISNKKPTFNFIENWRGRHLFKEEFDFGILPTEANSLTTYGTILRKSAVTEAGNFNQYLSHSEDRDLGKRILSQGFKIIGDPNLIVYSNKRYMGFCTRTILEMVWWRRRENDIN